MIKMPSIFSSGALYQHSSTLTLRGSASGKVDAEIAGADGARFDMASATAGADGGFELTLKTPGASLEKYRIVLRDAEGEFGLEDILFGELWLASGQSNMELYNREIPEHREYLESLPGLPLRVYSQNVLANKPFHPDDLSLDMPIEPTDGLEGVWGGTDNIDVFREVSAAGTAFVKRLYERYRQSGREIPVGFLNCNMGGTLIEGWLPYEDLDEDDATASGRLKRPDPATWNSFGGENFLQCTALYNLKVYPLRGVKCAGVVWYQGESNIGREGCCERYKRYLRRYYDTYRRIFGADDSFHIVMSLLFPFSYGDNSECRMSCINNAMSELAHDDHGRFTAVPCYDLPPVWGYDPFTHPIHPTNKYPLGERMADAYADGVTAPTFAFASQDGGRLLLRFNDLAGSLRINGERLYGLYIRGEDTPYMEADGELIDGELLAVSHPYIARPVHAAYQLSSLANDGNLCGGKLPVAQFCTEDPWNVVIERKPWLFTERPAAWFCDCPGDTPEDGYWDYAMHPTWQPLAGSEVCPDPVFKKNIASLRVSGETNIFGACFKRRRYNELDLQNYAGLRFLLFNANAVSRDGGSVRMELRFRPEKSGEYIVTRYASMLDEPYYGWAEFALPFGELPEDRIVSAALVFDVGSCRSHFVNIDALRLVPKGTDMPCAAEKNFAPEKREKSSGPALPSGMN